MKKSSLILVILTILIVVGFADKVSAGKNTVSLIKSDSTFKSFIWQQKYNIKDNKTFKIDLNGDKKQDIIYLGMDTPNGTKANVIINGKGFNLLNISSLYKNESLFDEYGELNEKYYIQVAFIDFDNDKKPEIVVAGGDNLVNLGVSIFKYTGKGDTFYKEIGYIEGQENIFVTKKKTIEVTYGSQGLFDEYALKKGKFIKK